MHHPLATLQPEVRWTRHVFAVGLVLGVLLSLAGSLSAQDWRPTCAPVKVWQAVASSADGTKLAAVTSGELIYVSTNSGSTWTAAGAPARLWWSVASSADGTTLLAGADDNLYISTNSGSTWRTNGPPIDSTYVVAVSADGTKWLAGAYSGLYTSTNVGATWNKAAISGTAACTSAAGSADGTTWIAVGSTVLVSTNSGATWTATGLVPCYGNQWPLVVAAADGRRMAALDFQFSASVPGLYVSTNAGASWTAAPEPDALVYSLACPGDGTRLLASTQTGLLVSSDFGSTWSTNSTPWQWKWWELAASADGSKLVAAVSGDGIYGWQAAPVLALALEGTNSVISWPALSSAEGFSLQRNSTLSPAGWTPVSATLTVTNGQYQMPLPLGTANAFYRLSNP